MNAGKSVAPRSLGRPDWWETNNRQLAAITDGAKRRSLGQRTPRQGKVRMEDLDKLGMFWLEGQDEDQLSGRLRFTPADGVRLDIVGIFDRLGDDDRRIPDVHGWVDSDKITLSECFVRRRQMPGRGVLSHTIRAQSLFIGHHVPAADHSFQAARLELAHLNEWIWRASWTVDDTDTTFTVARTEDLSHRFSRGTLTVSFSVRRDLSALAGVAIRQTPSIAVDYDSPQPLTTIRRDLGRIQSLMILCIDRPSHIDKITIQRPDVRQQALSGEEWPYPQDIELRGPLHRHTAAGERETVGRHNMLLTFDDVGGAPAIAAWLDQSQPLQRILDNMISVQHRSMYMENRFLNIVGAAEAFHRETDPTPHIATDVFAELLTKYLDITPEEHHDWLLGKIGYGIEPALYHRLQALSRRAGPATAAVIGSNSKQRQRWAVTVARLRNWLAHVSVQGDRVSGNDLRVLGDSVYCVLRACLLLECGIDQAVLNGRRDAVAHQLTEPIDTVVNRVYATLQQITPGTT